MKVQLSKGNGSVVVKHGTTILNSGAERPITTVRVHLPSGECLEGKAICHKNDQFNKRLGRKFALINLFDTDSRAAMDAAISSATQPENKSAVLKASLSATTQKFYKIPRQDRTVVAQIVCPELASAGTRKERRRAAEYNLYQRLRPKFEKKEALPGDVQTTSGSKLPTGQGDIQAGPAFDIKAARKYVKNLDVKPPKAAK